jgi:beta-alanine--pyruvate transaminase
MGGVIVKDAIHAAFMRGPPQAIELFHGYTYSAHPLACAAGLATLDLYREEGLFERANALAPKFAAAAMALKGLPNVLDIRAVGLAAAVDLAAIPDKAGARGYAVMEHAFHREGVLVRVTGDTIAISPPLIASEAQIDEIFDRLGKAIKAVG